MKGAYSIKSTTSRPSIYRSGSSHLGLEIENAQYYDEEKQPIQTLHRGLKSRMVQLLAIGGCIGM